MKRSTTNRILLPKYPFVQLRPLHAAGLGLLLAIAVLPAMAHADDQAAAIEKRLADSARYLASDELEGRGIGTKGIDLAADYIARQFEQADLKTGLFEATPMQKFSVTTAAELGPNNKLRLIGPPKENGKKAGSVELKPGEDFRPMSASGTGAFDLPLLFVGYGITGKDEKYDDYADVDVKGKAVVILRHEPQQDNPKSVFAGTKHSEHAPLRRKLSNAYEHGAAGVILCTDQFEIRKNVKQRHKKWQQALDRLAEEHAKFKKIEEPIPKQIEAQRKRIDQLMREVDKLSEDLASHHDPVLRFDATGGRASPRDFPVVHCRRGVLDQAVAAALGSDLAKLEGQIDEGPTPHSSQLTGWRITGQIDINRKQAEVKNVVGVLDGEGPLAEETVVLGAHYDHLGFGRRPVKDPKSRTVYNGADDNASGVAVLIEVARSLATRKQKLRRRVVFVAFTGEERGLLGSSHYVNHPPVPLEKTVAMLNLDMVGRLRDDKLSVTGTGTANRFDEILDRLAQEHHLKLTKRAAGFGPSDHSSFYAKKIPVMHFITGFHKDLHKPTDDFEKLNIPGMRRVARFVEEVIVALASAEQRPEYVFTGPRRGGPSGARPYLGTIPDFRAEGSGYAISGVVHGGPAQRAGLRGGDVITEFGQSKIGSLEDVDSALRKHKAGDRVKVVVRRGEKQSTFEVTLGPPR